MYLSVCAHCFDGLLNLEELFSTLSHLNIQAIELLGEPSQISPDKVRPLMQRHGTRVSCLTAASRLETGRDLSSPNDAVRRATAVHYKNCIDIAHKLDCPLVAVAAIAVGKPHEQIDRKRELSLCAEELRNLTSYATQHGVALTLEVLNRYANHSLNSVEEALYFIKHYDLSLTLLLDLFHMTTEERDIPAALRSAGSMLSNLHVADNNRAGLGQGMLPVPSILEALKSIQYQGALSFEAFPLRAHRDASVETQKVELLSYLESFSKILED